jgi:hypothetical protein
MGVVTRRLKLKPGPLLPDLILKPLLNWGTRENLTEPGPIETKVKGS